MFRVIPRCFMLFVAIVKDEISVILPCFFSFLYCRTIDFLEFILYPATLLKVFISCRSFLVEFLVSFMYTIISSAIMRVIPIWIPLIPLCCRIADARNSSKILKRCVESGQPCPVPDFHRMALSFYSFSLMLTVSFL